MKHILKLVLLVCSVTLYGTMVPKAALAHPAPAAGSMGATKHPASAHDRRAHRTSRARRRHHHHAHH